MRDRDKNRIIKEAIYSNGLCKEYLINGKKFKNDIYSYKGFNIEVSILLESNQTMYTVRSTRENCNFSNLAPIHHKLNKILSFINSLKSIDEHIGEFHKKYKGDCTKLPSIYAWRK